MSPAYNYTTQKTEEANIEGNEETEKKKEYNSKIYITNSLKKILTSNTSIPSHTHLSSHNNNEPSDNEN
jgi:hypothetical protein